MMRLGYILGYLVIASQLLPMAAWFLSPTRDANRLRVAWLCVAWFAWDVAARVILHAGFTSNLWLGYLFRPLCALLVFWILYEWQVVPAARLAIKLITPVYLVTMLVMTVYLEQRTTFSLTTGPLTGVLQLAMVLYTLVTRSLQAQEHLAEADWFWICSGLALSFGLDSFITPALRLMAGTSLDVTIRISILNIVAGMVVMLIIARGMFCPDRPLLPLAPNR